jgi:hypothetical protein
MQRLRLASLEDVVRHVLGLEISIFESTSSS